MKTDFDLKYPVKWGLGEEEERPAHLPPKGWTLMEWMLQSRAALVAWIKKADDEDLATLAEERTCPDLEAQLGWPLETEALAAAVVTARGALRVRRLRAQIEALARACEERPQTWQAFPEPLDFRDAHWVRDAMKHMPGISAKTVAARPGAREAWDVHAYHVGGEARD